MTDRPNEVYGFHRVSCRPRQWQEAGRQIAALDARLQTLGGRIYGVWRSQIGRPRDEVTVMTAWNGAGAATRNASNLTTEIAEIVAHEAVLMQPTLRPTTGEPPRRQGNFAFRWFTLPEANWPEFLQLCESAWPGFEASYDSQVIGLWRGIGGKSSVCRALLLTRRPNLAMWERSKIPEGDEEAEVRRKLSRRYDLCDSTEVFTTTLLSAADREDTARWT